MTPFRDYSDSELLSPSFRLNQPTQIKRTAPTQKNVTQYSKLKKSGSKILFASKDTRGGEFILHKKGSKYYSSYTDSRTGRLKTTARGKSHVLTTVSHFKKAYERGQHGYKQSKFS